VVRELSRSLGRTRAFAESRSTFRRRRHALAGAMRSRSWPLSPALAACPTVRGHCAPGLVAGRYQPLADDVTIAGDVRPNPSSAVDSEDKAKRPSRSPASLRLLPKRSAATAAELRAFVTGNRRAPPAISGRSACPLPVSVV